MLSFGEIVGVLLSGKDICMQSSAQQSDGGCEEEGTGEENEEDDK